MTKITRIVREARDQTRLTALDYAKALLDDFIQLHGGAPARFDEACPLVVRPENLTYRGFWGHGPTHPSRCTPPAHRRQRRWAALNGSEVCGEPGYGG